MQEAEEQEAEAEDSEDSDDGSSDAHNIASRDRKLRPRKEVSFNLDQMSAAQEASEEAVEEADSDAEPSSAQTKKSSSRKSSKGGSKSGGNRKRAESVEMLGDEDSGPAQLVEMQPVSALLLTLSHESQT